MLLQSSYLCGDGNCRMLRATCQPMVADRIMILPASGDQACWPMPRVGRNGTWERSVVMSMILS
jgi:hypothetical protein